MHCRPKAHARIQVINGSRGTLDPIRPFVKSAKVLQIGSFGRAVTSVAAGRTRTRSEFAGTSVEAEGMKAKRRLTLDAARAARPAERRNTPSSIPIVW